MLDQDETLARGIVCTGSEFDAAINPLNGVSTFEQLRLMAEGPMILAYQFLIGNHESHLYENKSTYPEEIVYKFIFNNRVGFLKKLQNTTINSYLAINICWHKYINHMATN